VSDNLTFGEQPVMTLPNWKELVPAQYLCPAVIEAFEEKAASVDDGGALKK
jgi:hypothetical protein